MRSQSMELPEVGDIVGEKYRLDAVLGEGGFGVVFRATTNETGRIVAVKVLKRSPEMGQSGVRRFKLELRAVAALESPHIPTLFDYGETEAGALYMVTEYVDGQDLSALIVRRRRLEESEVVYIVTQVLNALAVAHEAGLLHRDVKPSNIRVFSRDGDDLRVKLLDFGIAKDLNDGGSRLTGTGVVLGTPRYMAPEILRGDPCSAASDLYSLGLVARECLLGPSVASTSPLIRGPEESVLDADDPVSEPLRDAVNRLVAPEVTDRYRTARQALEAFTDISDTSAASAFTASTRRLRPPDPDMPDDEGVTEPLGSGRSSTFEELEVTLPREASGGSHQARRVWAPAVVAAILLIAALGAVLVGSSTHEPAPAPAPMRDRGTKPSQVAPEIVAGARVESLKPRKRKRRTPKAGTHSKSLDGIGWLMKVPDRLATNPSLIVLLRAKGVTTRTFLDQSGFSELAEEKGFVVIAPSDNDDLVDDPWTDPADANRIHDIVVAASDEVCTRDCRTYIVGQAAGARMAQALSCEKWVDGIAIHGTRDVLLSEPCRSKAIVMWLDPMKSPRLPWAGGTPCVGRPLAKVFTGEKPSHDEALASWLEVMSCDGTADETFRAGDSSCSTWSCRTGFEACSVDGGDAWPGMPGTMANCGSAGGDFPAAEQVWRFFERLHGTRPNSHIQPRSP